MRLNKAGWPLDWLTREEATTLIVKGAVIWSLGDRATILRGGVNRAGIRSEIHVPSIIACEGDHKIVDRAPALSNTLLFRRDQRCMYCGGEFPDFMMTRDHVIPRVQGGADVWTNVVAACQRCNHHKAGRTPEQAGMELLAVPFTPNTFEAMYMANRRILGDQMEYLQARFSGQRDWKCAA